MKLFRSTAVVLALTTGLLALQAQAEVAQQNTSGDPMYTVEAPKAYSMIGDLLIARPLLIGATVIDRQQLACASRPGIANVCVDATFPVAVSKCCRA